MAVKQLKNGKFTSSFIQNHEFETEQGARYQDDIETRIASGQVDVAEGALAKLSPSEIKALHLRQSGQESLEADRARSEAVAAEFFAEHREIISAPGTEGFANGNAFRTFFKLRDKQSWNANDLEMAYGELLDKGLLHIDKSVKIAKPVDESERWISPLDGDSQNAARISRINFDSILAGNKY
jgi:hypothetical protein